MWQDDDHLCRLLADSLVDSVVYLPVQRIRSQVDDTLSQIHYSGDDVDVIQTGSSAEGFRMNGSDVDRMYIDKNVRVSENASNVSDRYCHVKMVKTKYYHPGYVQLILLTPNRAEQRLRMSVKSEGEKMYVSSKSYVKLHLEVNQKEHGPCVQRISQNGTEQDDAHCLACVHWPSDAEEWFYRKRSHGWPDQSLVQAIHKSGCHVMPIGSKYIDIYGNWTVDPLVWRLSFSVAEKHLVYSFNDTQFHVYGIFKLLLKEAFPNFHHDDLCSYFMKTLVFWSIEETPRHLWQPRRLVSCIEVCFRKLISWVSNGFCPNYFVRENNMFYGRLGENERESLINHLSEMYVKGWRCLLMCRSMRHLNDALQETRLKILQMPNCCLNPEEEYKGISLKFKNESNMHCEDAEDQAFFCEIESYVNSFPNLTSLESEFFNSVDALVKAGPDRLKIDTITLFQRKLLQHIALFLLHRGMTQISSCTRFRYRHIRRSLGLLDFTSNADISRGRLTLATAFYCMGKYSQALKIIRKYESTIRDNAGVLYISSRYPNKVDRGYKYNFCNGVLSRIEKASMAVSYDFEVFQVMPIIPKEIALEILMIKETSSFISIPPRQYSLFLKALCLAKRNDLYNLKIQKREISDFLSVSPDAAGYLLYIMLAVCESKLDRFDKAVRNYYFAYKHKKHYVNTQNFCCEWESLKSPLWYVALLLRLLI